MLKKLLIRIVSTAYLIAIIPTAYASGTNTYPDFPFVDLNGHWAYYAVEDLYARDIVQGRSYYYYEPQQTVTRAEFVKMVLLNAGVDVDEFAGDDEPYLDVNEDDWFYSYVVAGYQLGLIHYNEYYRPYDRVNRAEAAAMLVRHADVIASECYTSYKDVPTNEWYCRYVQAATNWGVVQGYWDNTYRPSNSVTRAEAAVMVDNAYDAWYRYN
ncbi:S-layer homology domain-containing protein [Patescibacteria group bacterium]|nr:S-layer homology domain-containing protein [Patescibacteria group bacterium]